VVFGFFKRRQRERAAYALYGALVAQSRQPEFYLHLGIADTVDGRFDMIALHAALVIRRVQGQPDDGPPTAQFLFDIMFADMDRNLREMGVGDLSVGKHVKRMAKAYYGRAAAYEEGLQGDEETLVAALTRNLYRKSEPEPWQVAAIAAYVRRSAELLAQQDYQALAQGTMTFAPLAGFLAPPAAGRPSDPQE